MLYGSGENYYRCYRSYMVYGKPKCLFSVDTEVKWFADVVTEFIEGLIETYPGLQYLDGFPEVIRLLLLCSLFLFTCCYTKMISVPSWSNMFIFCSEIQVKVVLRADVFGEKYDKVAVISGIEFELSLCLYFNTGTCFLLVAFGIFAFRAPYTSWK